MVYFTTERFSKFLRTFLICNSNFNYQPCVSNSDSFFCNCCGSFTFIYSKFCSVNSTTIVGVNTYLSQTHTTLASHFCLCEMISVVFIWSNAVLSQTPSLSHDLIISLISVHALWMCRKPLQTFAVQKHSVTVWHQYEHYKYTCCIQNQILHYVIVFKKQCTKQVECT